MKKCICKQTSVPHCLKTVLSLSQFLTIVDRVQKASPSAWWPATKGRSTCCVGDRQNPSAPGLQPWYISLLQHGHISSLKI